MRLNSPRIAPVADDALTSEQAVVLEALAEPWRGLNLFRTVVRSPGGLASLLPAGGYIRSVSTLPVREREIVILRIGWLCASGYEWTQHVFSGRQAGLAKDEIAAIKAGAGAPGWSAADQALIRACDELHADQFITSGAWAALRAHFDEAQAMDVVFVAGHYVTVSMITNVFGVQLDPGQRLDPDLSRLE
jgi:4-carboxymuconolactone decarboxylase